MTMDKSGLFKENFVCNRKTFGKKVNLSVTPHIAAGFRHGAHHFDRSNRAACINILPVKTVGTMTKP